MRVISFLDARNRLKSILDELWSENLCHKSDVMRTNPLPGPSPEIRKRIKINSTFGR